MKKLAILFFLCFALSSLAQNTTTKDDSPPYSEQGLTVKPEFPGGIEQLTALVREKLIAKGYSIAPKEKILATVVIEKDGKMSTITLLNIKDAAKKERLTAILEQLPYWSPGKMNETIVRTHKALKLEL